MKKSTQIIPGIFFGDYVIDYVIGWPPIWPSMFLCEWSKNIFHDNQQQTKISTLTHWGRETHICVNKLTIIGSDNGLLPSRRQAIIWTNAGILLIRPSGTNFSEISIETDVFSFKKLQLKMSSAKWRPFCLGLNVLNLMYICIIRLWLHLYKSYSWHYWWHHQVPK